MLRIAGQTAGLIELKFLWKLMGGPVFFSFPFFSKFFSFLFFHSQHRSLQLVHKYKCT